MGKLRQSDSEQPLYVRWIPDTCPYALEMRLDLLTRLKTELNQAAAAKSEIGGVILGILPTQISPTLRLDEVILVPTSRTFAHLSEFTLDAGQVEQLAQMSAETRATGRQFAGFFRSHLRSDLMAPSDADTAMLLPLFPEGLYAFLVIGPQTPARQAAFFLAMGGHLPRVPSASPFIFEESTFQSLPEVPAEATEDLRNFNFARVAPRQSLPWPALLSIALIIFLIGTWTLGSRITQFFRPPSNQIDLTVIKAGGNLKITWDHSAPVLREAVSATIVISDGTSHRELRLNADDLRLGQVSYERLTKKVYVLMRLEAPGLRLPAQTFDWSSD